jgi:hypothetical protein
MSADQYPEVSDDDAGIVPPQGGRGAEWPKKIRTLTAAELDRLTIDAAGRFYWDGRLVNYEPPTPPKPAVEEKPAEDPSVDALDRSAMDILDRAALELSDRTPVEPLDGSDEQAMADRLAAGDTAATGEGVTAEERDSHRLDTDEARSSEAAYAVDYDAPAAPVAVEPAAHARSAGAEVARAVGPATYHQAAPVAQTIRVQGDRLRLALTGGQSFALVLLLLALLIGASGVAVSGWVAAHEWSCRVGLTTRYCPAASPETPRPPMRSDIPA